MSATVRRPTPGDLVGRDFARVRAAGRLSTRRIAWLVGSAFACACAAALRIDILRATMRWRGDPQRRRSSSSGSRPLLEARIPCDWSRPPEARLRAARRRDRPARTEYGNPQGA
jgi:hypothetical protein